MSGFEDREKGYERKFEHDQEVAFKVRARRNHLLGQWAAEQLGLQGAAAEAYARELADPGKHLHGDDEIVTRIAKDFAAKSVRLDANRIRLEIDGLTAQARKALGAS
ncbi:MAG: DUF1476 domain-containing protein [Stellaceae bacterium]